MKKAQDTRGEGKTCRFQEERETEKKKPEGTDVRKLSDASYSETSSLADGSDYRLTSDEEEYGDSMIDQTKGRCESNIVKSEEEHDQGTLNVRHQHKVYVCLLKEQDARELGEIQSQLETMIANLKFLTHA